MKFICLTYYVAHGVVSVFQPLLLHFTGTANATSEHDDSGYNDVGIESEGKTAVHDCTCFEAERLADLLKTHLDKTTGQI